MRRRCTTREGSVGRWAAIAFSSSIVVPPIVVFALLGASVHLSPFIVLILILAGAYLAPIFLLDSIERFSRLGRKRIWIFSAILHAPVLLLAVVGTVLWSWAMIILLLPEVVGGILLSVGIRLHGNAAEGA
jgi:hypothetical protein